jgi:uncharacterized protein
VLPRANPANPPTAPPIHTAEPSHALAFAAVRTIARNRARRLALTAQGFDRPRPEGTRRDVRHLRRVLDRTQIVQLDSVNVLARAHELPFFSRLGAHDRAARDAWLWGSREAYEGWIHVASMAPVEVWPLLAHRREEAEPGRAIERLLEDDPAYLPRVLDEIAERGPTSIQDLEDPGRRTGPWWGGPKGKHALVWLARTGRLAVHDRTSAFVTRYDLTERVLPAEILEQEPPPRRQAVRELLLRAARSQGVGTAADLADHHRLELSEAREALDDLVDEGVLEEVQVDGWRETAFLDPTARAAREIPARALLSPFDPVVWFRPRLERLFDFHYRIEIYVPRSKRVHGYYVLPFLLGDRLVARVDLKADRATRRLRVHGAFAEAGVDRTHVAEQLAAELADLATWLELDDLAVDHHGDLARHLRRSA